MLVPAVLLLIGGALRSDPAEQLLRQFERRLASTRSVEVVANGETYRFMGRRYRVDSLELTIVCNGSTLYRKDAGKQSVVTRAPTQWPDDLWLRGFEKLAKGPYPPTCTNLQKTTFAGKAALEVDTRYSESPMFSSEMYFDAKSKLPLGYRAYSYGNLDREVVYSKVDLNAKLKSSDFLFPKN